MPERVPLGNSSGRSKGGGALTSRGGRLFHSHCCLLCGLCDEIRPHPHTARKCNVHLCLWFNPKDQEPPAGPLSSVRMRIHFQNCELPRSRVLRSGDSSVFPPSPSHNRRINSELGRREMSKYIWNEPHHALLEEGGEGPC